MMNLADQINKKMQPTLQFISREAVARMGSRGWTIKMVSTEPGKHSLHYYARNLCMDPRPDGSPRWVLTCASHDEYVGEMTHFDWNQKDLFGQQKYLEEAFFDDLMRIESDIKKTQSFKGVVLE